MGKSPRKLQILNLSRPSPQADDDFFRTPDAWAEFKNRLEAAMDRVYRGIWERRYFLISLVQADIRSRYRRSVLGLGWSLLNPLAMALILAGVFHSIFHADVHSFLPFLLSGLAFWTYLTNVMGLGCHCFLHAHQYLRQAPTPLALFPLRTALANAVHLLAALGVAILMATVFAGPPTPLALVSLLPALGLTIILGWSLAALAGVATVWFQDIEHLMQVGLQILFYVTPVLYPPEMIRSHPLAWVLNYNPLVAFLSLFREPILNSRPAPWPEFAVAATTAAAASLLATLTLHRIGRTLVFYL